MPNEEEAEKNNLTSDLRCLRELCQEVRVSTQDLMKLKQSSRDPDPEAQKRIAEMSVLFLKLKEREFLQRLFIPGVWHSLHRNV